MKVHFRGVGDANHIDVVLDHPAKPNEGEGVSFQLNMDEDDETWDVITIVHTPMLKEYDVYCVVGRRMWRR